MEVVVSAPGKVLLTGGYLVLERPNAGIVLSASARFFAIVRPLFDEVKPESWAWSWVDVKVTSPQLSREITYKLSLKNSELQLTSSRELSNPFVEQAIQFSVAACKAIVTDNVKKSKLNNLLLQGLHITILGSNEFYSYRNQIQARHLPLTQETLAAFQPFSSITFNSESANGVIAGESCKPEVAKTGLGSSAAMTASAVAALLHYLGAVTLSHSQLYPCGGSANSSDLDLIHSIAQSAHCIAQGKVGSGFDVSAAVYGSQRYIRFSPEILSSAQAINGRYISGFVGDILNAKWDHERTPVSLPPLMTLLLGEPGAGGSSTPSMVGAVKKWQKSDPEKSQETWRSLGAANSKLEEHLRRLGKYAEDNWEPYNLIIRACSSHFYGKWMELASDDQHQQLIVKSLLGARDAFLEIRFYMREMGKAANVPIEPDTQTRLLDATMEMEGVVFAGVPGAGGFDAIFAVLLEGAGNSVGKNWSSLGVLPLLVREDPHGVALEDCDPRTRQVTSALSSLLRE